MILLKKTIYDKLVAKLNNTDTSGFDTVCRNNVFT